MSMNDLPRVPRASDSPLFRSRIPSPSFSFRWRTLHRITRRLSILLTLAAISHGMINGMTQRTCSHKIELKYFVYIHGKFTDTASLAARLRVSSWWSLEGGIKRASHALAHWVLASCSPTRRPLPSITAVHNNSGSARRFDGTRKRRAHAMTSARFAEPSSCLAIFPPTLFPTASVNNAR